MNLELLKKVRLNHVIGIIFTIIHISVLTLYKADSSLILGLSLFVIPIRLFISKDFDTNYSFSQFVIWGYLEMGFIGHYFFKYFLQGSTISFWPLEIGLIFLLTFFVLYYVFSKLPIRHLGVRTMPPNFKSKKIGLVLILTTLLAFTLSFISFKLNITRMGIPHDLLPYKMEPLLNLSRIVSIPIFFSIIFHYAFPRWQWRLTTLSTFILWLFYESYIRGSRGVLVMSLIPVGFYLFKSLSIKKFFQYFAILAVLGASSFMVGNYVRRAHFAPNDNKTIEFKKDMWLAYYRVFNEPNIFLDFERFHGRPWFKNNYTVLKENKGANHFYTKILVNHKGLAHSQGLTALSDGFLTLGLTGSFLTLLILFLIAKANDFGRIPIISRSLPGQVLVAGFLFTHLIWADGFFDFYLTRSIFTILVFPLSVIISYKFYDSVLNPRIQAK